MTYRTNIDATGRDFYFAPSGDNKLSGYSIENAVADPAKALALIDVLSPQPSGSQPASMSASVTGSYSQSLILIDFVSVDCSFASISIFAGDNITAASNQTSNWGALLNFGVGSCYLIDAKTRHRSIVNAMVVFGTGITVTGVCDDVFCELIEGELRSDGAILIDHTATSPTPIIYDYKSISYFEKNQTFIRYDPIAGSSETVINVSTISMNPGADTAGSTIAHVIAGDLIINGGVLKAETFANIDNGGRLIVNADLLAGDTNAMATSGVVYKSIGLYSGDITLTDTSLLLADIAQMNGSLTVGAGCTAIFDAQFFAGNLTVNGTLTCVIDAMVGTITNNGTINGIINGVPYGNWTQKHEEMPVLNASSFIDQNPAGFAPLQLTFGAAQFGASDPIQIDASGNITANQADQYNLDLVLQYGRTGAGGVAFLFFRVLINGIQFGDSRYAKLDGVNDDLPVQLSTPVNLNVNDIITVQISRDAAGNDSGGVITRTSSAGWNQAPSASISLTRNRLVQPV